MQPWKKKKDFLASALFTSQISQKQIEIKYLECSLQENNTQEVDKSLLTDKQSQPHITTSMKQTSIQQEIDQLNIQLNNFILENRQAERVLQEVSSVNPTFPSK